MGNCCGKGSDNRTRTTKQVNSHHVDGGNSLAYPQMPYPAPPGDFSRQGSFGRTHSTGLGNE